MERLISSRGAFVGALEVSQTTGALLIIRECLRAVIADISIHPRVSPSQDVTLSISRAHYHIGC